MINLTSPVSGGAQTGLTSPTYGLVADITTGNSKQYAIMALGGTQTGVEIHAIDNPFTLTIYRPSKFKTVAADGENARNYYSLLARKGVIVNSSLATRKIALFRGQIEVPAGAESSDPESIRAMLSCAIGALQQLSAGIGDTAVTGIM